jgi:hypothetical protein
MACHYRFHIRGAPLSVYELALAWTAKSGNTFFASAKKVAANCAYSVQGVHAAMRRLVKDGWFEQIGWNRGPGREGGHWRSNEYKVVDHMVWALKYPGKCKPPVTKTITGRHKSHQIETNHRC